MRKSIVAIALVMLLAPTAALPQAKSGNSGVYEQLNLFGEAFERIRRDAVDPVADQRLVQTAIAGMLAGLDPHSVYLDETQYKALQDRTASDNAASTGLVVTLVKGQLEVVAPRDGSPAAKADIKPGDFIYTIDKEPIYDLTLPEIEQRLHGKAGSKVALILRRGSSELIKVTLSRVATKFPTVTHRLEGGDIGYIRLAGFDDATPADLAGAVKDLQQQAGSKLIGYVLDLRNNPGGSFDMAVKAADAFIDKGDIATVKSRKPDQVKHIAATPGDVANGQPIVALVNGGTAREAELVAGALQDSKRAVLIGSKTFGSSAIETLIPLAGNGAIELTTARFLTPSGRPIQGKGLEPDLIVSPLKLQKVVQADRLREADLPGALKNPDAQPTTTGATTTGATTTGAPPAGTKVPPKTTTTASPPKGTQPTVASGDIGTSSDEQLSEAIDVLRGLAVVSGRTASAAH
ncbi:MAG TPA: S41 family peptidase [Stellaceae bacterium]|nr:S41 family peptidase [Stellaceae bacterium]